MELSINPRRSLRLAIITDLHYSPAANPAGRYHNAFAVDRAKLIQTALQRCAAANVQALAILGDLSDLGDRESLEWVVRQAASTASRVWIVPGNHDVMQGAGEPAQALRELGTADIALLTHQGVGWQDWIHVAGLAISAEPERTPLRALGRLEPERWSEGLVLCLTHYPLLASEARVRGAGLAFAGDLANREQMVGPLERRSGPSLVLHGHLHVRDEICKGRVLQFACGPLIEPPHEITLVDVTSEGDGIQVRRLSLPVAESAVERLPVLSPAATLWTWDGTRWTRSDPPPDSAGSISQR
jgi:predicted phosphodiesterase